MPRKNKILIRNGTTTPSAADFDVAEPAFDKTAGKLYVKNAAGLMVEIGAGGGGGDGGAQEIFTATTTAGFPATGAAGVLYLTDSGRAYRWDSSGVYVEIGPDNGSTLWSLWLPPAPTGLAANSGNASVGLSWTASVVSPQTPVTDYLVQLSSDNGATWTTFSDVVSAATTATVIGLTNGTAYVFRVAAVNALGQGEYTSASSSVTPGFDPSAVAGLQLWLDASDASTLYNATTGGDLVAADGAVARWQDKSGNARHATQATSGSRPIRKTNQQNGLDALLFDGTNDTFALPSITIPNSHSVFQVYRRASSGIQSFGIASTDVVPIPPFPSLWAGDNILYQISNDEFTIHGTANTSTGYFVVSTIRNGTTSIDLRRNAANVATVTAGGAVTNAASGSWNAIAVRDAGRSNLHTGNLCEIVVYDSALSASDLAAVENYLMQKWGVS
jgi:hypothetical protein